MKKIVFGFLLLIIITPLGLLSPGAAWGEWGLAEIKQRLGFIPQGMGRLNGLLRNILPGYGIPGFDKNFFQSALGYIVSAVMGVIVIILIFRLIAWLVPEKKEKPVS